jgi:hypothetical protein
MVRHPIHEIGDSNPKHTIGFPKPEQPVFESIRVKNVAKASGARHLASRRFYRIFGDIDVDEFRDGFILVEGIRIWVTSVGVFLFQHVRDSQPGLAAEIIGEKGASFSSSMTRHMAPLRPPFSNF